MLPTLRRSCCGVRLPQVSGSRRKRLGLASTVRGDPMHRAQSPYLPYPLIATGTNPTRNSDRTSCPQ
jgi:hypothetical protein